MVTNTLKTVINSEDIKQGITLAAATSVIKIIKNTKTFNNVWDIAIGNKLEALNQKSIFKNQQSVEKYKNDCLKKMSKIPEEKMQDPKISIIGPALEASKFYIDEEEIRNMFASLIASSMNTDYNHLIHHSFVEIIKQLSPLDARILSKLKEISPFVSFRNENELGEGVFINEVFFWTETFQNPKENAISLLNLQRQGLIKLNYQEFLTDKALYNCYHNSSYFKEIKRLIEDEFSDPNDLPRTATIRENIISITDLGLAFRKVCCDDISE